MKYQVNHGIEGNLLDLLNSLGFEPKRMMFYNSRKNKDGTWSNFLDQIECMSKHVKSNMGGNYGLNDEYLVVNSDGIFTFQYFGDSSARVNRIADADKENILKHSQPHI